MVDNCMKMERLDSGGETSSTAPHVLLDANADRFSMAISSASMLVPTDHVAAVDE